MDPTNVNEVYILASFLLSENGENPEYDRGVINLVAELDPVVGMDTSTRMEQVEVSLREAIASRG